MSCPPITQRADALKFTDKGVKMKNYYRISPDICNTAEEKATTYTQEQVKDLVADVFAKLSVRLEDPSLIIAGVLALGLLDEKFKRG